MAEKNVLVPRLRITIRGANDSESMLTWELERADIASQRALAKECGKLVQRSIAEYMAKGRAFVGLDVSFGWGPTMEGP